MIVCKKCGNHNGDQDSFCTSCGAFLEWSGERLTEPEPAPTPSPAPPPPPAQPGLVQRVKQAVGIDEPAAAAPQGGA
jgi:hypothetical protein